MQDFMKHFVRAPDGEWLCIAPAEIPTHQGRVQVTPGARFKRGSFYMGLEIAKLLDEQSEKDDLARRGARF
jgi:hypothetical protein